MPIIGPSPLCSAVFPAPFPPPSDSLALRPFPPFFWPLHRPFWQIAQLWVLGGMAQIRPKRGWESEERMGKWQEGVLNFAAPKMLLEILHPPPPKFGPNPAKRPPSPLTQFQFAPNFPFRIHCFCPPIPPSSLLFSIPRIFYFHQELSPPKGCPLPPFEAVACPDARLTFPSFLLLNSIQFPLKMNSPSSSPSEMVMNVPTWAWWTFGLCLLLVLLFLLLDWLLIRRNALGSSPICLSFRRHPSGKYGYSSSTGSGGLGGGGADWQGGQGGYAGGSLGPAGGQSVFGHHKRSTNLILSV